MKSVLFALILWAAPAQAGSMTCEQVYDVAQVILEDPYMSGEDKFKVLSRLFGERLAACANFWDAND